jgi:hypothetical protein
MTRRIFIAMIMVVVAMFAATDSLYAQEYNRERLRGNVRTVNNGGLVPIDSAALKRA